MLKTNKIQNKFILISRLVTLSEKSNLSLCHWKSNMRLKLSMLGISDFDFSTPRQTIFGIIIYNFYLIFYSLT